MSSSKFQAMHRERESQLLALFAFYPIFIIKHSAFFVHFRFFFFFFLQSLYLFCVFCSFTRPLAKMFNDCSFVIVKKHVSCLVLLHTTQLFEHFILVSFFSFSFKLSNSYAHRNALSAPSLPSIILFPPSVSNFIPLSIRDSTIVSIVSFLQVNLFN